MDEVTFINFDSGLGRKFCRVSREKATICGARIAKLTSPPAFKEREATGISWTIFRRLGLV